MGTWRVRSEPASGRQGHRELLPRHRTQPRESSTAAALHGALVKLNTVLQSLSLLRTPSWGLLAGPPSNWRALTIPDDLVLPRACRRQGHLLGRPRFWAESGCSQFPVGGQGPSRGLNPAQALVSRVTPQPGGLAAGVGPRC